MTSVAVPDLGDFKDVPVIEVHVAPGDTVAKDQTLAVVESDKATLDIPCPEAGVIDVVLVKVGDRVSTGSLLATLRSSIELSALPQGRPASEPPTAETRREAGRESAPREPSPEPSLEAREDAPTHRVHAGPAVRRLARELGVRLENVTGTGRRGRLRPGDVRDHVKSQMTRAPRETTESAVLPMALAPWPTVDFARFGPVDVQPLTRIQRISGANLHRNWVAIPHVTNHDDADVTELEAFRSQLNRDHASRGVKVSPLAFIIKACIAALRAFPSFNASLDGENLVLKRYFHIGFAADTPNGLVVPVIRNADRKGILDLSSEMSELAAKARAGKLTGADMQGGCFSISSLGGIGGSYFTPIINAPEVAILGVGKIQERVVWRDGAAAPRRWLPLSLSWDHRVVDGAAAGRFNASVAEALTDVRRLLL
jgi:pyruvate dehydrogenase E2 component (dihydrolipoamide acetyltransferase)